MYAMILAINEYEQASAELRKVQKEVKGWLLTPEWDRFKKAEWQIHTLGLRGVVGAYGGNVWD